MVVGKPEGDVGDHNLGDASTCGTAAAVSNDAMYDLQV